MEGYAKARYALLGNGSHWFPGANADALDGEVSEAALREALVQSPWCDQIPSLIRDLRKRLQGLPGQRLTSA